MFFDALTLFDGSQDGLSGIKMKFPDEYENKSLFTRISQLSIPDAMRLPETKLVSSTYCFNVGHTFCYNWAFLYKGVPNALTVISNEFLFVPFMRFIKSVRSAVETDPEETDPYCRFIFTRCLLEAFRISDGKYEFKFPYSTETADPSNPTSYLAEELPMIVFLNLELLWKTLFGGHSLVFSAQEPSVVSAASLVAISLVHPLVFADDFLLFTQPSDPLYHNSEEISKFKVFGYIKSPSDPEPAFPPNFAPSPLVIKDSQVFSATATEQVYKDKMKNLIKGLSEIEDDAILSDPYYDILSHVRIIEEDSPIYLFFKNASILMQFRESKTYWKWRSTRIFRPIQRTAFLSVPPAEAVAKLKDDEIQTAHDSVSKYKSAAERDVHLSHVLDQHLLLLSKRLQHL